MTRWEAALFVLLLIAVTLSSRSAHADAIPTYLVQGNVSIVGTNLCSGPCVESVDFSFDFTYVLDQTFTGAPYRADVISLTSTSFGPTGTYTYSENPGPLNYYEGYYIVVPSSVGGELELLFNDSNGAYGSVFPMDGPPEFGAAELWCPCTPDFADPGFAMLGPSDALIYLEYTDSIVPTPEASTLGFLLLGISALAAFEIMRAGYVLFRLRLPVP